MKRIVIAALLLLAAAAFAGVLGPQGASAEEPAVATTDTVSVSGTGSVSAVPDTAQVSAGVETRAATARAALDANSTAMRKVIDALRAAGGKDVTTQVVSLSPRMDDQGRPDGFVATNVVTAETSLDDVGALIDAAVTAGANTIWGPSLSRSDQEQLYRQALEKAVADAKRKADVLAAATGRSVGRVVSIVEGGATPGPLFDRVAGAAESSVPVVSGPQDTTATVSVTYELR
ncbi:MAG: SIMPL domain-containing protein [Thermoleophilia bacterium]|nr:SIMPL domain-containing protein [Thermoleophilia bacterium]MDH4346006.1 SIMPL domain-containing protein [Thermoleophilia bacterium]MDH5332700.1 SIMPL domain-containing protein [Thermoleophilia bacterium]